MKEEWKNFDDNYMISNYGNVYSIRTKTLLKPQQNQRGYLMVSIYRKSKKIHRLVAETFIPNPNNYPDVNHINENITDNRVENLEWCTKEYNHNYGTRNKRVSDKMINGKLSKQVFQYDLNGNLIKEWPSTSEIERKLGYNHTNISACCLGRIKQAYGYIWKYKRDVN